MDYGGVRAHVCGVRTVLPAHYTLATSNEIQGTGRCGSWRESAQRGRRDHDGSPWTRILGSGAETGGASVFHCGRSLASMSLGARASCDVGGHEGNAATGTPRCGFLAHSYYRGFK